MAKGDKDKKTQQLSKVNRSAKTEVNPTTVRETVKPQEKPLPTSNATVRLNAPPPVKPAEPEKEAATLGDMAATFEPATPPAKPQQVSNATQRLNTPLPPAKPQQVSNATQRLNTPLPPVKPQQPVSNATQRLNTPLPPVKSKEVVNTSPPPATPIKPAKPAANNSTVRLNRAATPEKPPVVAVEVKPVEAVNQPLVAEPIKPAVIAEVVKPDEVAPIKLVEVVKPDEVAPIKLVEVVKPTVIVEVAKPVVKETVSVKPVVVANHGVGINKWGGVHDNDVNLGYQLISADAANLGRDQASSKQVSSSVAKLGAGKGGVSGEPMSGNSGANYGASSNSGDNSAMNASGTTSTTGVDTETGQGYRRTGSAGTDSNSANENKQ